MRIPRFVGRLFAVTVAAAAAAVVSLSIATPAQAADVYFFRMVAEHSNDAVSSPSSAGNNQLDMRDQGSSLRQRWTIVLNSDNTQTFLLRSAFFNAPQQCMSVNVTTNAVVAEPCNGSNRQRWRARYDLVDAFHQANSIVPRQNVATTLFLTVSNASQATGAKLIQAGYSFSPHQRFFFIGLGAIQV